VIDKIEQAIERLKPEIERDFAELISIRSVKGEKEDGFPFGKEIGKVLETGLNIGRRLGFATKNLDGYAGILELGESEEYFGIFGHLDVVVEGKDWDTLPYKLIKKDGKFYGRGVLDNKGPILACIYALKILKDLQVNFNKRVRVVLGTDEESGMKDMDYYLSNEKPPLMGFTPDCKFPVVYGENGVIRIKLRYPLEKGLRYSLKEIEGDFSKAYIPDYTKFIFKEENFEVIGVGKRAPSNNPYLGENSIINAIKNIPENIVENLDFKRAFKEINSLFSDVYGKSLGIDYKNLETGEVLVSLYEIKKNHKTLEISFSVRYPVDCDEKNILEKIQEKVSGELEVEFSMPKTVKDKNSTMVKKMSEAYFEVTNLDSTPVTTTGGTYARKVPNIVAFGPSFPGEKGIAHNKNEYLEEESLYKLIKIYTLAIYKLLNI
jgi:succinyl-diaminopimelate desuccinylase